MTRSNRASLQRRCADAGFSTEGTKKDLTARLKTSESVGVVVLWRQLFIKKLSDYPRPAKHRKLTTAGRRSGASFNPVFQLRVQQVALAGATHCSSWKQPRAVFRKFRIGWPHSRLKSQSWGHLTSTTSRSGTVFLVRSFLTDQYPAQYTSSEHTKQVTGDRSAHHGAPLIDSFLYTDGVRSDTSTFTMLYGLTPDSVSLLRESRVSDFAFWVW